MKKKIQCLKLSSFSSVIRPIKELYTKPVEENTQIDAEKRKILMISYTWLIINPEGDVIRKTMTIKLITETYHIHSPYLKVLRCDVSCF